MALGNAKAAVNHGAIAPDRFAKRLGRVDRCASLEQHHGSGRVPDAELALMDIDKERLEYSTKAVKRIVKEGNLWIWAD